MLKNGNYSILSIKFYHDKLSLYRPRQYKETFFFMSVFLEIFLKSWRSVHGFTEQTPRNSNEPGGTGLNYLQILTLDNKC